MFCLLFCLFLQSWNLCTISLVLFNEQEVQTELQEASMTFAIVQDNLYPSTIEIPIRKVNNNLFNNKMV